MYEIYLESTTEKDLKRLPSEQIQIIVHKIKSLSKNPSPSGAKKIKGTTNFWRIRIGRYRVVYEVLQQSERINIYKIKHRKDVYK